jgi:hypothetical protein
MPRLRPVLAVTTALLFAVLAPVAHAGERKLTLFSKPITVKPYTGEQTGHRLRPNGLEAPSVPGYITRIDADVVSRRSARARTLSIQDVMIHHLVYVNRRASYAGPANCFGRFFARGEERQVFKLPKGYGLPNRRADGGAPPWFLIHMLMNHRPYPMKVFVRLRVTYSDGPLKPVEPWWVDTRGCLTPDPVFDVPGGRRRGSTFYDRERWRAPYSGRIVAAGGHLHGGGKYAQLSDVSCGRRLVRSRAYYGPRNHAFYRVRPILHEPSPIRMGIYASRRGIPVAGGDVLRLTAAYDNRLLHTRVMSIMIAYVRRAPVRHCERMPRDVRLINPLRRGRFRTKYPPFRVPLVTRPRGPFSPVGSAAPRVTDYSFSPWRISARRGQTVTWRFSGNLLHNVTVANGPRGFSSRWTGRGGQFSYRPRVPGTYRIFCSLHPAAMTQELRVR